MDPKIPRDEWLNPKFQDFGPHLMLARLWIISNPGMDLAGSFLYWDALFTLQTKLEGTWLETALKSEKFMERIACDGKRILDLDYVHRNYTLLGHSGKPNTIVAPILKCVAGWSDMLQRAFFLANPELEQFTGHGHAIPMPSPCHPHPKGWGSDGEGGGIKWASDAPEQNRTEQNSTPSSGECEGGVPPAGVMPTTEEQVLSLGVMRGITAEVCRLYFHDRRRTGWVYVRGGESLAISNWHSDLWVYALHCRGHAAEKKNGRVNGERLEDKEAAEKAFRARLDAETDPTRRAAMLDQWMQD